ncbi:substrate-binding domain-containing protein [Nocardiopsis composta]
MGGSRSSDDPRSEELLEELRSFASTGGRAVFVSQPVGGLGAVRPDNAAGAAELGAAVTELGYRRAAVITGAEHLQTVAERVEGLRRGLEPAGGRIALVERDDFDRAGGYRCTRRLIESGRIAEADVLCAGNDVMAIGAMTALRDGGIEPGRDIAVTGFNDIETAADVTPGSPPSASPRRDRPPGGRPGPRFRGAAHRGRARRGERGPARLLSPRTA